MTHLGGRSRRPYEVAAAVQAAFAARCWCPDVVFSRSPERDTAFPECVRADTDVGEIAHMSWGWATGASYRRVYSGQVMDL